jgi:dTDP-4-amino-4,6-dideoxygalactose transaminase
VIVTVTVSPLDLDLGTKGQRFVRRRHGVVVVRDAAGSFGSTMRRVSHGVHRCDTVFGMNWNVKQTKYERGDQPSHA